jgi:hypothetical protein
LLEWLEDRLCLEEAKRVEGARDTKLWDLSAMTQLEELGEELDIADAAWPQLQVIIGILACRDSLLFDAGLDLPDRT